MDGVWEVVRVCFFALLYGCEQKIVRNISSKYGQRSIERIFLC